MHRVNCLVFTLLFIAAAPCVTQAQKVVGKWYGIGFIDVEQTTNSYLCELQLVQTGNVVTGEFNYYFRNGYFSNPIKGSFNPDTRFLIIQLVPVMYNKTVNTLIGVDCPMHGEFTLRIARTETTLAGNFMSDELHKFTCSPLKVTFRKEADNEPSLKERVGKMSKDDYLEADTVLPVAVATKEAPVVVDPLAKFEPGAVKLAKMRNNLIARILDMSDDSVRVDLYDNGELDYDTVSVFYNQKLVKYKQMLDTRKPIEFYVHVDSAETNNDLVMFAENLGQIPPNSAIMIVTDKQHRYEVSLSSDYLKKAAVRLRKVYKNGLPKP
jgi:hypothetical protein